MKGSSLWRIAALCLTVCLLAACGPMTQTPAETSPDEGATPPTAPESAAPLSFALPWYGGGPPDPTKADSAVNLTAYPLIYDGLFAIDHAFTPQPALCLRAEASEDSTVWTLFLREDVNFSDGTRLTPALVRDCLRAMAAGTSTYAARLSDVKDIELAEGRVIITLHRANAALPALLDVPIFLPDDTAIGTGPYVFTPGTLERAATWWRAEVLPVTQILLHPVSSADEMLNAFDAGQITLVTTDLTGSSPLGYAGNYEPWEHSTANLLYIGYQTARGPCADVALRRALALSMDRATVAASLLDGHATPAALPIHPVAWRDKALEAAAEYDPQTAAALLDELGYQAGEDGMRRKGRTALELTFLVNNENPFKLAVAEYLADDLGKRGIAVTLKRVGYEDYLTALRAGAFDLYLGECRLSPDFDVTALVAQGGALNYGSYRGDGVSDLLDAVRTYGLKDTAAARALYEKLQDDAPVTPLCFKSGTVLTRWGRVSGVAPTSGNVFYQVWTWTIQ